ncbi:MAG TPA: 23S rRNA (guanosine(2251)-2'-O)-methyltransferase RlmB [Anaerolineales bacterium]|nr:23S rRNA (guanosine(2251)-2'-O)-methyltransferase RlmB [Anaerolineales bacterium]
MKVEVVGKGGRGTLRVSATIRPYGFIVQSGNMKEFIYSRNAVYETLRAKRREVFKILIAEGAQEKGNLKEIIYITKQRKIKIERVPRGRLDKINKHNQGVVAEVSGYPYSDEIDILDRARKLNEQPFILLLDSLNDPQNFGTLIRTAEAVGVHGVIIPLAHTVEVTPAVVNTSSGASEHMLIARSNLAQSIDTLKAENVWVVGLDQNGETIGEKTKRHLTGATAVVVGSEGEGIRRLTRDKCDIILQLPMRGQIESLNAAVAGSVALYLAYLNRI